MDREPESVSIENLLQAVHTQRIEVIYPEGSKPQFVTELEQKLPAWVTLEQQEVVTRGALIPFGMSEVILTFAGVTIATGILSALGEDLYKLGRDAPRNLPFRKQRKKKTVAEPGEPTFFRIRITDSNIFLFGDAAIRDLEAFRDGCNGLAKLIERAPKKREAILKGKPQRPDREKVNYYRSDQASEGVGTYFFYEYKASRKRWTLKKIEVYEAPSRP